MTIELARQHTSSGIAWHCDGEGSAIVLIHGVGLRLEAGTSQIKELAASHCVYAPDLPGHGESIALPMAAPTLADFVEAIGTFTAAIPAPHYIVGHSLGALIALSYADSYPDRCSGVVALNAIYRRDASSRAAVKSRVSTILAGGDLTTPVGRWFDEEDPEHIKASCRQWLDANDRQSYAAAYSLFATQDGPSDELLERLSMRCLFLTGENDPNSTPAMSDAMAKRTGGDCVIIPGARHMAHLTHAEAVNEALVSFFSTGPDS